MDAFRFFSPYWFLLVPVVLTALWWVHRPRRRPAIIFSSVADLKELPVTVAQVLRRLLPLLYALGLVLLVGALARPQWGQAESRRQTEGIAIQLVLDVSGSMEALDFRIKDDSVSRLEALKHVIIQFVTGSRESGLKGRPDDLIGVVAFGGFADSKCPLTLDHGAVVDVVNALQIPRPVRDRRGQVINQQALQEELLTAIGDGLTLGLDRLRASSAKSKIIILVTDGDNNAGVVDPRTEATSIAQQTGVKIYTIGIGRSGVVPFPVEDAFGQRYIQQQRFVLDEDLLKHVASSTGGQYFHASDTAGLARVYAEIDKLERTKVEESLYTEYHELFPWLALPGLVLLGLTAMLHATRFRSLP